jgi:ankyrin repeat protein
MAFALELGAEICDDSGDRLAPIAMLLETYCRNAKGKHECLDLLMTHGVELPDTPTMALHRGRIDLLEQHLHRDPHLLSRTFSHHEIYPPELSCHSDPTQALCGTPVIGTTLLHMAVDYNELEIVRWVIDRGADVDARAAVDAEGFGGHTALFNAVVAIMHIGQKYSKPEDAPFARLLLEHGANPNARASLRKQLVGSADDSMHEYPDVTPLAWGRGFHDQGFVNQQALKLIEEYGGLD